MKPNYNAYCINPKCKWVGLSRNMALYGDVPDQCPRCHQRGKIRPILRRNE